jgi:UDP-N-acetyl-D-mannosaminuronic acid transferase (WecB/TagA/CpsF family)
MSFVANFALNASRRPIFGLPVCDLDWNSSLSFVDELTRVPAQHTVISFLTASNAKRTLADPEYRAALSNHLFFPQGSGMDSASLAAHGARFPSTLSAQEFVPALLTYMDKPKRVGLIGDDADSLDIARRALSQHTPWHDFQIVDSTGLNAASLDLLLVGIQMTDQDAWVHRHVRESDARLVITVGKLFDALAGKVPQVPELLVKLRLSWLYRLCLEPHRLLPRRR